MATKKITVLPNYDHFYKVFIAGKLEGYPDPTKVKFFGFIWRDKTGNYLWVDTDNCGIIEGSLEGVVREVGASTQGQEGIIFADRRVRDVMLRRYTNHFKPY